MSTQWLRIVPDDLVPAYVDLGWRVSDNFVGCHHEKHSVSLMVIRCERGDRPPPMPDVPTTWWGRLVATLRWIWRD